MEEKYDKMNLKKLESAFKNKQKGWVYYEVFAEESDGEHETKYDTRENLKQKKRKEAPRYQDYEQQRDQKQKEISELKLEAAEKKWILSRVHDQISNVRRKLDSHKAEHLTRYKDELDKLQKQHNDSRKDLNSTHNGRRIYDPEKVVSELQDEIQGLRLHLRTGDVNHTMEVKIIRQIKEKEKEKAQVEEYIEKNIPELQRTTDDTRKQLDAYKKDNEEVRATQRQLSEELKEKLNERQELKDEIKEIQHKLSDLVANKGQIDRQFEKDKGSYLEWKRELDDIKNSLASKRDTSSRNSPLREKNNKESRNASSSRKPEARAPKEDPRAAQKLKAELEKKAEDDRLRKEAEDRRKKAIKEYEKMQEQFERANAVHRSQNGGAQPEKQQVIEEEEEEEVNPQEDSYAAQKQMCHNLIRLCESLKPKDTPDQSPKRKKKGRRRKKRNAKVTISGEHFSNFSSVGVKSPSNVRQLDATIRALQERIEAYDNNEMMDENEDEPAIVDQTVEEQV